MIGQGVVLPLAQLIKAQRLYSTFDKFKFGIFVLEFPLAGQIEEY